VISISTYDAKQNVYDECFNMVLDIDEKMSVNRADSEISKVNQRAGEEKTLVSDDTYKLIEKSKKFSELSDGLFDITIGAVVEKWKVSGIFAKLPKGNEIEETLPLVGYDKIELSPDNYIKLSQKGMKLDLGAVAKGYACDKAVEILKKHNVKSALLDFGGNIYVHGTKNDGSLWKVGIRNPLLNEEGYICYIEVSDKSIVTSGVYERYFSVDDENYHHLIDPRTGYPSDNGLISVTIISPISHEADILSTACFVSGVKDGLKLLEKIPDADGIFITSDKKIYMTDGLKDKIKLTNSEFTID